MRVTDSLRRVAGLRFGRRARIVWPALILAVLLLACSGHEQRTEVESPDVEQDAGGDAGSGGPTGGGNIGIGMGGGEARSTQFRIRFSLSAPVAAPAAESESYRTEPGIEVQRPGQ